MANIPFFELLKVYLVTVPIFFAVDLIWLGFVAKNLYQSQLSHLLSKSVNWPAAIIFYLLFILGIVIFATIPALKDRSIQTAFLWGGAFGFFCYMTYDLTNLSTLKNWPLTISLIDITWGTILSALVAAASFYISQNILKISF